MVKHVVEEPSGLHSIEGRRDQADHADQVAIDAADWIMVRPPYFALTRLRWDGSQVRARVHPEMPLGREAGPVRGSEAARHMAIAGSLAVAYSQRERVTGPAYYLATSGLVTRVDARTDSLTSLVVRAHVVGDGKALVTLEQKDGQALYKMLASYRRLSTTAFDYLFASRAVPKMPGVPSPFSRLFDFDVRVGASGAATATVVVDPTWCAGHFERVAALPVAVMADLMNTVGAAAASAASSPRRLSLDDGYIEAHALAWPDETLEVTATANHGSELVTIDVRVDRGSETLATMRLTGTWSDASW